MNDHSVILITGGSEGIGYACAMELFKKDHIICILSRSCAKLEKAVLEIGGQASDRIFPIAANVCHKASVNNAIAQIVDKFGKIDVLIHSAGSSMHAPSAFEDVSEEEYMRIMHTNTDGMFFVSQAVLSVMKLQKQGYILNILSTASHTASIHNSPYSASKFAALALTDTLIEECRNTGIRISSISPGPVATTIWSHKTNPPDHTKMELMLQAEDIARIAIFILENPSYVHIRDIVVTPWYF